MLAAAEAVDAQEDETFGQDKRGDELPDWTGDKQKRLEKIARRVRENQIGKANYSSTDFIADVKSGAVAADTSHTTCGPDARDPRSSDRP
jgi:hypothetical protein